MWPDGDAIGKRLHIAAGVTVDNKYPAQTVVGIVKDVRYRGIDDGRFDIYMPATQTQHRVRHLMVRAIGDPAAVARSVQAALRDAKTPTLVTGVTTMERVVTDVIAPWRFSMTLLVGLAALGVFLAAAGLFALVAYSVEQRAPELALRLAIGADPGGDPENRDVGGGQVRAGRTRGGCRALAGRLASDLGAAVPGASA